MVLLVLVHGKKCLEAGVGKAYNRKSIRITNSPFVFPDTYCLGQVPRLLPHYVLLSRPKFPNTYALTTVRIVHNVYPTNIQ